MYEAIEAIQALAVCLYHLRLDAPHHPLRLEPLRRAPHNRLVHPRVPRVAAAPGRVRRRQSGSIKPVNPDGESAAVNQTRNPAGPHIPHIPHIPRIRRPRTLLRLAHRIRPPHTASVPRAPHPSPAHRLRCAHNVCGRRMRCASACGLQARCSFSGGVRSCRVPTGALWLALLSGPYIAGALWLALLSGPYINSWQCAPACAHYITSNALLKGAGEKYG